MFYTSHSLGATMAVVVCWSLFVPMACGASYGIAPFITRRGLGVATGLIGAGGERPALPRVPPCLPACRACCQCTAAAAAGRPQGAVLRDAHRTRAILERWSARPDTVPTPACRSNL